MATKLGKINVDSALLCEGVRQELGGKYIILGVYTGDVVVPAFPAGAGLSVFLSISAKKAGGQKAFFRFITDSFRSPAIEADVVMPGAGTGGIPLPTAMLRFAGPTELRFEAKADEGDWVVLLRRRIVSRENV